MAERTTKPAVGMHDAPTGNPATDYSLALLTEFVRLGVRDIVLSPGSRSQALARQRRASEALLLVHRLAAAEPAGDAPVNHPRRALTGKTT